MSPRMPCSEFRGSSLEFVEVYASEEEAGQALEAVAQAKRRRGYRDL